MTDRTLSAGVITETESRDYAEVAFVELLFESDPVRVWTGIRQITATMPGESSQTWDGIGDLGNIDNILESIDGSENGVKLIMSGIANDLLANALTQDYQGRSAKIWSVFLNDDEQIIPDPVLEFGGQMDQLFVGDGDKTGAITVQCESRVSTLNRTSESLLTDEEQQRLFPDDLGLQFVLELQSKTVVWGPHSESGYGGGRPRAGEPRRPNSNG